MTPDELRAVREANNLSRRELAEVLAQSLGRNVSQASVRDWESDRYVIPADVQSFLEAVGAGDDEIEPGQTPPGSRGRPSKGRDSAPSPDGPAHLIPLASGAYATVCTQMFEIIATGVGMVGAATGSEAVRRDGLIINADKERLGAAWGKLAETNETFRNMLVSADKQGAYLAIGLATGTTFAKIYANHQAPLPAPIVDAAEQMRGDVDAAA